MRNQLRPSIESLESKTLLSHLAAGLTTHAALQIKIPPRLTASGLAVSLTTDQSIYSSGEIATMTLMLTDVSNHKVGLAIGPSIDGFNIRKNGGIIWRSNAGPEPQHITIRILHPGQSIVLTERWTVGAATGSFVVHNQLFPRGPAAGFNVIKPGVPPVVFNS